MTGWIGIALGDASGIGPEVVLKALAHEKEPSDRKYLIIGDRGHLLRTRDELGLRISLEEFTDWNASGRFYFFQPGASLPSHLIQGSPAAAGAAIEWLTEGARLCLRQKLDALVTAPVNKAAIIQTGIPFIGQTEFLSNIAGCERTSMMLLGFDERGRWLRVVLATTHLPLELVPTSLSPGKVERAIELAAQACRDLGLPSARIGVCGLNPHAGEDGELGMEENTIILPVVQKLQSRGLDVTGPLPADALFYYAFRGDYDVVVAMYHDQGLCPVKMIGFENGVNWTLGLPFVRTSPDHGTAYDIAGLGRANPSSTRAALELARQLSSRTQSLCC